MVQIRLAGRPKPAWPSLMGAYLTGAGRARPVAEVPRSALSRGEIFQRGPQFAAYGRRKDWSPGPAGE